MKNTLLLSTMVACIGLSTVTFTAQAADPGAMHKDKMGGGAMLKGGVVGGGMAGQRDAKQMGGAAKNACEMTGQ